MIKLNYDPECYFVCRLIPKIGKDKIGIDKIVTNKIVTDKIVTEKMVTDKLVTDKIVTDKILTDKILMLRSMISEGAEDLRMNLLTPGFTLLVRHEDLTSSIATP